MKKLFGNWEFYKKVIIIVIPVMLQQGISAFVNLLDNIMVANSGETGNLAMAGVGVSNQLFYILNITIIGGVASAGIYLAQFYGAKNKKGVQESFRFKLYMALIMVLIAILLFVIFGDNFINLFLQKSNNLTDKALIFDYSRTYMLYMLIGLIPFGISQVYASSLREMGKTVIPMLAGISAVLTNLLLNSLLIGGNFSLGNYLNLPAYGVVGAAIATIVARFVELIFLIVAVKIKKKDFEYLHGVYATLKVSKELTKKIIVKGAPLVTNEFLWSLGMTILTIILSFRGTSVLEALTISSTTTNLFYISFSGMATAISIIVGQNLGAGELDKAVDNDRKLITCTVIFCFLSGIVLMIISPIIPKLYPKSSLEIKNLATSFMIIIGIFIPIFAFNTGCFFTLRAGGVTIVTFLFDSLFVWVVVIPLAYLLSHYVPQMNVVLVYMFVQLVDIIKSIIGFMLVRSRVWVKNLAKAF